MLDLDAGEKRERIDKEGAQKTVARSQRRSGRDETPRESEDAYVHSASFKSTLAPRSFFNRPKEIDMQRSLLRRSLRGAPILLGAILLPLAFSTVATAQPQLIPPLLQAPPPMPVPTAVIVVDQSGAGNYLTIKDAVNNAPSGAYIKVKAGTYIENDISFGYKELVLESIDGLYAAIVDGTPTPTEDPIFILEHSQTAASVINGFMLINGVPASDGLGGAIKCIGTSPTIINNKFEDNTATYGGAIYGDNSSPRIAGNIFAHNGFGASGGLYVAFDGGAVNLQGSASVVTGNLFRDNYASSHGGALSTLGGSTLTIDQNTFDANGLEPFSSLHPNFGGAIAIYPAASVTATNNTFTDNRAQISGGAVWISGSALIASNFTNNLFDRNSASTLDGGAVFGEASNAFLFNNTFSSNLADNVGGAICFTGAGSPIIHANKILGNLAWNNGGGIACVYDANAQITRNLIEGNDIVYVGDPASSWGTGAGIYIDSASVTIRRNTILKNGHGTAAPLPLVYPTGNICLRGAGIDYVGGSPFGGSLGAIESNQILENQVAANVPPVGGLPYNAGAGVALKNMGTGSRFLSNVVARNYAKFGGCHGAGVLVEQTIVNPFVGAFRFANNTIAHNQNGGLGGGGVPGFGTGGGVLIDGVTGQFKIDNCIIWQNVALSDFTNDPVVHSRNVALAPILANCDVDATAPNFPLAWSVGGGMLYNVNPLFNNPVSPFNNYHLVNLPAQQLINAGNNAAVSTGEIDMDGAARINGGTVDIGADEV